MITSTDPRYLHCPRQDRHVNVCTTEGRCRDRHGCTEPECPLAGEFGFSAFDRRMRAFCAALGLWPLSEPDQPRQ